MSIREFCPGHEFQESIVVGSGSTGIVCKSSVQRPVSLADATLDKEWVAIKKIERVFEHLEHTKRVVREIIIMRSAKHENLLSLEYVLPPAQLRGHPDISNMPEWNDVYLVTRVMDTDLEHVLASKQPLSRAHIQYFMYQVLAALAYLHSGNVVHRDLKPSNILCNKTCEIKIADFGLARVDPSAFRRHSPAPAPHSHSHSHSPSGQHHHQHPQHGNSPDMSMNEQRRCSSDSTQTELSQDESTTNLQMTGYVVTRWYRAPEVLLGTLSYTTAIDIWSAGCILAEFFSRKPMFPGKDFYEQIKCLVRHCGLPSQTDLLGMKIAEGATEEAKTELTQYLAYLSSSGEGASDRWQNLLPDAPPDSLDLISRMLKYDPRQRISAVDAMRHPFFQDLFEQEDIELMADEHVFALHNGIRIAEERNEMTMRRFLADQCFAGVRLLQSSLTEGHRL
eukprot:ANDGO_05814.mRNA.1 Extracellular signal-regulated kinase 1